MPPRVFIDTNTLISGLLFSGNEERVLDLAIGGKIKLVMSKQVVDEAKDTLAEKFELNPVLSGVVVMGWSKIAEIVDVSKEEAERFKGLVSTKDARVLAAAVKSKTEFFVSGDRSFHRGEVKRIANVVTTKQLLEKLKI